MTATGLVKGWMKVGAQIKASHLVIVQDNYWNEAFTEEPIFLVPKDKMRYVQKASGSLLLETDDKPKVCLAINPDLTRVNDVFEKHRFGLEGLINYIVLDRPIEEVLQHIESATWHSYQVNSIHEIDPDILREDRITPGKNGRIYRNEYRYSPSTRFPEKI